MPTTVIDFRVRFPEFSDEVKYPDARIEMFITDAELEVCEDVFGKFYSLGVCYLAAHFLTVGSKTGKTGKGGGSSSLAPIASKTADKLSVTKAIAAVDPSDPNSLLYSTAYGQRYLEIWAKVRPIGPLTMRGNSCCGY